MPLSRTRQWSTYRKAKRMQILLLVSAVVASTPIIHQIRVPEPNPHVQGARSLTIGEKAPPIAASAWLLGEPVDEFVSGHVYVMEFWASWCLPCVSGMPHLSELQRQYADEVTIVGMNIWEEPEAARRWMAESGSDIVEYTVAIQQGTEMETLWMSAAGQDGIPTAFIIDQEGLVAWIGHPGEIDEPLSRVVESTWDLDAARLSFESDAEAVRRRKQAMAQFEQSAKAEIDAYVAATEDGDLEAIAATSSAILSLRPPTDIAENLVGTTIHRMLVAKRAPLAVEYLWEHKAALSSDLPSLVMYGRSVVHDDLFADARDAELAIALLTKANELTEYAESEALSLLAQAHLLMAAQTQRKSVEHASDDAKKVRERRRLADYEHALEQAP